MTQRRLLTLIAGITLLSSTQSLGQNQAAKEKIHALLVGVTNYPGRTEMEQLTGPANDVSIMAETLQKRFGVEEGSVTRLVESQPDSLKPSYANIKREFLALAERVQSGDQVFVLLSGHGSQVPNNDGNAATDWEHDGLDEVFLPRDKVVFNKEKKELEGPVIRDDEIEDWLTRIQNKGATVLFVSDSCHSESQTRGGSDSATGVRYRDVKLIPDEYLDTFRPKSRGGSQPQNENVPFTAEAKGSLIAFFAARGYETTPDGFRQPKTWKKIDMGMLTYAISEILRSTGPRITYRELGQQINKRYAIWKAQGVGANVPTPIMHATDLDRVVLGNTMLPGRSRLTFARKGEAVEVSGGSIDGLTAKSVLELFPEAGSDNESQSLGWAIVDSVNLRKSSARVVRFNAKTGEVGKTISDHGLVSGRCDLVVRDYGGILLRIGLAPSVPTDLAARIKAMATTSNSPFEIADAAESEFVFEARDNPRMHSAENRLMLSRPDRDLKTTATFDLGPVASPRVDSQITGAIERIWKAKSLTDIAFRLKPYAKDSSNSSSLGVSVAVVVELGEQDRAGAWTWKRFDLNAGKPLPVGAEARFTLKNYSPVTVRATLLYVGDDYGITPLGGQAMTLSPANNGEPSSREVYKGRIERASRGFEAILAIATRHDETMQSGSDYTYLRQDALPGTWMPEVESTVNLASIRGKSKSRSVGQRLSPLDRLLDSSSFKTGKTRSSLGRSRHVADYAVSATTWVAKPKAKSVRAELENIDVRATHGPVATGPWRPDVVRQTDRGVGKTIYPKVAPAIVVVRTKNGHGTGFLISSSGLVLTNHHVVEDAAVDPSTGFRTVDVNLGILEDGWMTLIDKPVKADIYKWSETKDLAVLKLRNTPPSLKSLPTIKLAEAVPAPGSDCVAIGHPGRGALWTLRSGSVAGKAQWPGERIDAIMQRLRISESQRSRFKEQLEAAPQMTVLFSECGLNPGDSGGPLLNEDGKLIAVSFAIPTIDMESGVSYDKFSYHVHLDEVKAFIKDLPTEPLSFNSDSGSDDKASKIPDPGKLSPKPLSDLPGFTGTWTSANLSDLTANGNADTVLLSGADGGSVGMLIDLDEDSDAKAYENAQSLSEIIASRDAEVACVLSDAAVVVFYDTDNDGSFDLRLSDNDRDGTVDARQVRKGDRWEDTSAGSNLRLLTHEHFEKSFRDRFKDAFQQLTYSLKKQML